MAYNLVEMDSILQTFEYPRDFNDRKQYLPRIQFKLRVFQRGCKNNIPPNSITVDIIIIT